MKDYYVIGFSEDVPLFFDEEWKPSLPEFNQVVKNPSRTMFRDFYELSGSQKVRSLSRNG